ncbi:hypothetical protein ACN09M_04985 [Aliarcobacter butzleri]|uniref:hypothetical protein n=1 Tax=Aliarcobacter butzleri TaxID=28197 RepID=UPI003ADBAA0A
MFFFNLKENFWKCISKLSSKKNQILNENLDKKTKLEQITIPEDFKFKKNITSLSLSSYQKKSKKKDLQEEYKILQSKIDTYSSAMLRFRGLMLSLMSAVVAYKFNFAQNPYFSYIFLFFLLIYFFYKEFLTNKATKLFENRLFIIEKALKNEKELYITDIFEIAEISRHIKIKKCRESLYIFLKSIFILGVIILIDYIDVSKNKEGENSFVSYIYNFYVEKNSKEQNLEIKSNEILLELSKINKKIDKNNYILDNIDNNYYECSVDK